MMNEKTPRRAPMRLVTTLACVAFAAAAAACGGGPGTAPEKEEPAQVEPVAGSEDLFSITLTERAAQRLAVQTVAARAAAEGVVVPYSAVFYGPDGETWVYVSPAPLTYVREVVEVADIVDGQEAVLSDGPEAGTNVVTVGVAELYGTEFEVGH
jgi:hypothetical protein